MKNISKQLWFRKDFSSFFLIPSKEVIFPGTIILTNQEGKEKYVNADQIAGFSCTKEEAQEFLQKQWEQALQTAKKSWLDLYEFSRMTGETQDLSVMKEQFIQGLRESGIAADEAFDFGRQFVEQFNETVAGKEPESDEEKQEVFRELLQNLPEVLSFFDEKQLAKAANDPDAWAEKLHQKVFGKMDARKKEKSKEKLAKEIRDSIAQNLRNAGITPSVDFDKEDQNP